VVSESSRPCHDDSVDGSGPDIGPPSRPRDSVRAARPSLNDRTRSRADRVGSRSRIAGGNRTSEGMRRSTVPRAPGRASGHAASVRPDPRRFRTLREQPDCRRHVRRNVVARRIDGGLTIARRTVGSPRCLPTDSLGACAIEEASLASSSRTEFERGTFGACD